MPCVSRYRGHPLYAARVALLLCCAIGVVLGAASAYTSSPWRSTTPLWTAHVVLFCLTACLVPHDLVEWAIRRAENANAASNTGAGVGDGGAQLSALRCWPLKGVVVADLFLCIGLTVLYVVETVVLAVRDGGRPSNSLLEVYASLPALVAALLHGWCFGKGTKALIKSSSSKSFWSRRGQGRGLAHGKFFPFPPFRKHGHIRLRDGEDAESGGADGDGGIAPGNEVGAMPPLGQREWAKRCPWLTEGVC